MTTQPSTPPAPKPTPTGGKDPDKDGGKPMPLDDPKK